MSNFADLLVERSIAFSKTRENQITYKEPAKGFNYDCEAEQLWKRRFRIEEIHESETDFESYFS